LELTILNERIEEILRVQNIINKVIGPDDLKKTNQIQADLECRR
jgi:hypothetical protein